MSDMENIRSEMRRCAIGASAECEQLVCGLADVAKQVPEIFTLTVKISKQLGDANSPPPAIEPFIAPLLAQLILIGLNCVKDRMESEFMEKGL